jgi:hypothetical protein
VRTAHAKGAYLQVIETIGASKIARALCQRMSKPELTLGDTRTKTREIWSEGIIKAQSEARASWIGDR